MPISTGSPPQTPMGKLTALPRPPSCILGVVILRGGRRERAGEGNGKGGEGWRRKEGREGKEMGNFLATPPSISNRYAHQCYDGDYCFEIVPCSQ